MNALANEIALWFKIARYAAIALALGFMALWAVEGVKQAHRNYEIAHATDDCGKPGAPPWACDLVDEAK